MALVVLTSIATLLLLALLAHEYMQLQRLPHLVYPRTLWTNPPLVSLLIPVRNEARSIARCLDGVLSQSYHPYEVVVVDDHSTDATPTILAQYAARDTRLRVIQSNPLPAGWTGKCHACQQAADAAHGEWLLFLDADTAPQPDLVAALVSHTQHTQHDMITVFPFLELGSFWERLILPPFFTLIRTIFPFERLNAPDVRPDEVIANGQCILIHRPAYDAIGGHGVVRNAVLDDVMIAQTVRRAGFRTGAVMGLAHLRVRMYTNGREVVEGLTKNAIAGYKSGGTRSVIGGIRQFALALIPPILLAWGIGLVIVRDDVLAWAVFAHALVVMLVAYNLWRILLHRLHALPWVYALFWPFGLISYGMITLRSLWMIRSGRGVVWKGRTYAGV